MRLLRTRWLWALVAVAIAATGFAVRARRTSSDVRTPRHVVVNGVDQARLHKCLAQPGVDCTKTVPGLAECMAKRLVCNPDAMKTPYDPLSRPDDPQAHLLSEQEAIALVRKFGANPKDDPATHPAYAVRMKLGQWNALTPSPESPTFDSSRVVWVVTVHAPRRTDPEPGGGEVLKPLYSSLVDAQIGTEISGCFGCAWVRSDGTVNARA